MLCQSAKQSNQTKGGHNKEIFMLNIETFKKFCLKSETKKADEVHDYFIKLEKIMFEITKEECEELKTQLQQMENTKNKEMETKLIMQKGLEKERVLLDKFANSVARFNANSDRANFNCNRNDSNRNASLGIT